MTEPCPQLSCVILSWNRRSDLSVVLKALLAITTIDLEIIVVDNASTDESPEMIRKDFPGITLVELSENIGIQGWNRGMEMASAESILLLDDDSYPDEHGLIEALLYLEHDRHCGVLALRVINERMSRVETETFTEGNTLSFVGCGAIIRKSLVRCIGGFDEHLFLYEHEIEYSMRAWNAGYSVRYFPGATVHHIASPTHRNVNPVSRSDCRRIFHTTKNILYILLTRFPPHRVVFRAVRISFGRMIAASRNRCGWSAIQGVFHGWKNASMFRDGKQRLGEQVCRMYDYGSYAGGFFFDDATYSLRCPRILRRQDRKKK